MGVAPIAGWFATKAYLYTEGLVRFCSEAFTLDHAQLGNGCVHLTNNEAFGEGSIGPRTW